MNLAEKKELHTISILTSQEKWDKIRHQAIDRRMTIYQMTNLLLDEGFKVLEQNEQK